MADHLRALGFKVVEGRVDDQAEASMVARARPGAGSSRAEGLHEAASGSAAGQP
jgi:hypothetical protein